MSHYKDQESFYREDPRRARSRECEFGLWHGRKSSWRLVWLEQTGELYRLTTTGPEGGAVRVLARIPHSGHPAPRRSELIVEALLAGWTQRSGQRRNADWLDARLTEINKTRLATIDWTTSCATGGCPAHGEPVAAHSPAWPDACPQCVTPRTVGARGLTSEQLEAKLRAGAWWLAEAPQANPDPDPDPEEETP